MTEQLSIPRFYKPRPYQQAAWARRLSGKYDYYFKIWHRQAGKDTDDIQFALYKAWSDPGTQSAYVGLNNKWVKNNIWNKYVDKHSFWDEYPDELIEPRDSAQLVKMLNNPDGIAPSLLRFIGFKEEEAIIGSSYDNFYVSELSLYRKGAFEYIKPIWEMKKASGLPFSINFNFTPRGLSNLAADMLREYTGEDDPEAWPGEHGRVYVDVQTAKDTRNADGTRVMSDEQLAALRASDLRMNGSDAYFRQEYLCEFMTFNAGAVYPGLEYLRKEGRFCPMNLRTDKPVWMAWDISSKGKESDWTSCVVFQYIDGRMIVYDYYEDNRKAVVECVQEFARRDYFHLIRGAALPWDSDRSGSRNSPIEECRQAFPNITWHKLDRTASQQDGINRVRKLMPNMVINSALCDWLMTCLENYEYRELVSAEDFSATPKHNRYSHLADAMRYCADMIAQFDYVRTGDGAPKPMPARYAAWEYGVEDDEWEELPPYLRPSKFSKLRKKSPEQVYGDLPGWKLKPPR